MDDHGRTALMKEGVATDPECHKQGIGNQYTCAIGSDQQIRQIARMLPLWGLEPIMCRMG